MAAIAAAAPLLAIEQILHCLLGFGIDKLMIRSIGKGNRKEADRIFGAVLIAVLAVYLIVYILLLETSRSLQDSTRTMSSLRIRAAPSRSADVLAILRSLWITLAL